MNQRVGVVALGIALFAACADEIDHAGDTTPPDPVPGRFVPVPPGSQVNFLPPSLANADVVVMLEMAGDPVALVSSVQTAPMTRPEKQQLKQSLAQLQDGAVAGARALGAQVLGQYQSAYNGVKVKVAQRLVPTLRALPGVIDVHEVPLVMPENVHGVPLIGAPAVWGGVPGLHGEGIKIAIIDSGIDYTHADFGGPGTPEAYTTARAAETAPADPAYFGPGAPKVKGGIDLVGDAYSGGNTPMPDPNPLDCNGHGSHVAGSAGGLGVNADGTTYTGSYDAATIGSRSWIIAPGVAPAAELYAVRVFGCTGGTNMTVDAIEWAVDNDMDVINMSLGSAYGRSNDVSATAASNAAAAGVIVVTSAGNSGNVQYLTGSPGTGTRVIATSAMDPWQGFPAANTVFATGTTTTSINANGAALTDGTTLPVKVLFSSPGVISLGCDPNEYDVPGVAGALVITRRGTCARVARAIFGQQAGAAAVLMVNNATSLPPFEGPITRNPDTGQQLTVTIPFLGVPSTQLAAMAAADGSTVTLTNASIANPTYSQSASFTSGGPRTGDSWLKPDVAGPGVAIISVGVGTGNGVSILSGTSMASPHNAGMAALVRQAHPTWSVAQIKAAIINTADPGLIANYSTRLAGSGLIQALPATRTQAIALNGDTGTAAVNFGFAELSADYSKTKGFTVRNRGTTPVTFDLAQGNPTGVPHSVSFSTSQVTVNAGGTATVNVTLDVPAATVAGAGFQDAAGLVVLTPVGGSNNGVTLRVPYYFVPQATSKVAVTIPRTALDNTGTGTSNVTNPNGTVGGTAEYFAWGLSDAGESAASSSNVKAVGVQALTGFVVFSLHTVGRWSNAAGTEYDVYIDVNQDGTDDYLAISYDHGLLTVGVANGQPAVAVVNLLTNVRNVQFFTDAPANGRALAMPVAISQLCAGGAAPCLSAANPRFNYRVQAFGRDGTSDTVDGIASFNAFTPALSTGMSATVAPNATAGVGLAVDEAELALTPARGWLVMVQENAGASEALLKPYVPAP